jgi:arylsulfatase A-like enzyme
MCDRWFGYLMESLRVLDMLDDTMVIFTADHGHSIGDGDYMGKRGYPSAPEVYDIPLMVRLPGAQHAGASSDMFVTHTDITAEILKQANVEPPQELEGKPFVEDAVKGKPGTRDHVTVGWGSTPTLINDRWWFNCKVDGTGFLLFDMNDAGPSGENVAEHNPDIAKALFEQVKEDAGGSFPEWLVDLARNQADAPGCSEVAARE